MSDTLDEFAITKKVEKKPLKKKVAPKDDEKTPVTPEQDGDKTPDPEIKKSKVKASTVDPKELKKIEKNAEKFFDLGSKKKKKKRNEKIKKITALKLEPGADDTDELIEKLKESMKIKEDVKEKVKETTPGGYWTQPLKTKEETEKEEKELLEKKNESTTSGGSTDWIKSERDYFYHELVDHVYSILKTKNPSLSTEKNKRIVMKPPQVMREGTTKTNFANFQDICSTMNRPGDHVQSYLLTEMGATASVDGNGSLIIKGKFQGKGIESLLRKYMQEYVVCPMCGSMDTTLNRSSSTRLFSLHCSSCGAQRTVTTISKGYQTVANKKEKKALLNAVQN